MTIAATCATIAAVLASAQGGETISLSGQCPTITIDRHYPRRVTINAGQATVAGLIVTGGNIRWRSGLITAPAGRYGFAGGGYGVLVYRGASNVRFDAVTITAAKKGMVLGDATNVTVADARFTGLGEDGIIASQTVGLIVTRSRFSGTVSRPSQCTVAGVVTFNVARRDCLAALGAWQDSDHADAIQMRNGVANARITDNEIEGPTQGITQMDTTGDAPLSGIVIAGNIVRTSNYHPITLGNCIGCRIMNNRVERMAGSPRRAIIIAGMAYRCGNVVPDQAGVDAPC